MKRVGKKILAFGMIFFGLALFLYPTIQTQEINIKSGPYIKEVDKSYKNNKKKRHKTRNRPFLPSDESI